MVSSSPILPAATSWRMARDVKDLLMEPRLNFVSTRFRIFFSRSA